jgi:ACS family hexuronate transporter-like MFS transporter
LLRWRIAVLVSAAIAINYLDRQTLPVAISAIGKDIPLSNVQFSALQSAFLFSYAFMYAGGGRLADALGTRLGFTVILVLWSIACASHAILFPLFRLAGVGVCNALRAQALVKYLSFRAPPPLPSIFLMDGHY